MLSSCQARHGLHFVQRQHMGIASVAIRYSPYRMVIQSISSSICLTEAHGEGSAAVRRCGDHVCAPDVTRRARAPPMEGGTSGGVSWLFLIGESAGNRAPAKRGPDGCEGRPRGAGRGGRELRSMGSVGRLRHLWCREAGCSPHEPSAYSGLPTGRNSRVGVAYCRRCERVTGAGTTGEAKKGPKTRFPGGVPELLFRPGGRPPEPKLGIRGT